MTKINGKGQKMSVPVAHDSLSRLLFATDPEAVPARVAIWAACRYNSERKTRKSRCAEKEFDQNGVGHVSGLGFDTNYHRMYVRMVQPLKAQIAKDK